MRVCTARHAEWCFLPPTPKPPAPEACSRKPPLTKPRPGSATGVANHFGALPQTHSSFQKATARGFEPLRAEPNAFRVHLLSRSDTVSIANDYAYTILSFICTPARQASYTPTHTHADAQTQRRTATRRHAETRKHTERDAGAHRDAHRDAQRHAETQRHRGTRRWGRTGAHRDTRARSRLPSVAPPPSLPPSLLVL